MLDLGLVEQVVFVDGLTCSWIKNLPLNFRMHSQFHANFVGNRGDA